MQALNFGKSNVTNMSKMSIGTVEKHIAQTFVKKYLCRKRFFWCREIWKADLLLLVGCLVEYYSMWELVFKINILVL